MGNSGRSTGNHLHLDIEDDRQNIILNPLILLPSIQDIKKPKITALLVKINDKIYTLKRKSFLKYKGKMQIYLIAMDLRFYFPPKTPINLATGIGIKKLTLKIDNKVVRTYDFSFFKKEKNGLLLSNKYYFKEVYGLKFNYRFGDFMPSRKTHTFKAEVEDWNNNSSVEIYRISFR